mmetsp:Transcript_52399/g.131705  ORF Transcript_52399/g.131705 Transcript_52399/m.131705 type:complete len:113 (+) Transcript_52399:248-586(+)
MADPFKKYSWLTKFKQFSLRFGFVVGGTTLCWYAMKMFQPKEELKRELEAIDPDRHALIKQTNRELMTHIFLSSGVEPQVTTSAAPASAAPSGAAASTAGSTGCTGCAGTAA